MRELYRRKIDKFKQKNSMLMSNKKWLKFFTVMREFSDCEFYYKGIFSKDFAREFDFSSMEVYETGLGDCLIGGPIEYEMIESILIPIKAYLRMNLIKIYEYNNNFDRILAKLSKEGMFPVEHIKTNQENGIIINRDFVIYDYLIIKGYHHLPAPFSPLPRRGSRAKRMV